MISAFFQLDGSGPIIVKTCWLWAYNADMRDYTADFVTSAFFYSKINGGLVDPSFRYLVPGLFPFEVPGCEISGAMRPLGPNPG